MRGREVRVLVMTNQIQHSGGHHQLTTPCSKRAAKTSQPSLIQTRR